MTKRCHLALPRCQLANASYELFFFFSSSFSSINGGGDAAPVKKPSLDPEELSNITSVSNLSFWGKVYVSVEWLLNSRGSWVKFQSSFMPDFGTETCLSHLGE